MAGLLGFIIDIANARVDKKLRNDTLLFSESQGRFLVSVNPANAVEFEKTFKGLSIGKLGIVSNNKNIEILSNNKNIVKSNVDLILNIYKDVFREF